MENGKYKIVKTNSRYKKSVWGRGKKNPGILILMVIALVSTLIVSYKLCRGSTFLKRDSALQVETVYDSSKQGSLSEDGEGGNSTSTKNTLSLTAKQYGVFTKEENALDFISKLNSSCGYIIRDGDKIKVMGEIYSEGKIDKVLPKYNSTNFVKSNITFNINDQYDKYTAVMIDAMLQIANEFSISETESVKTDDIKKWVNDLEYKVADKGNSYNKMEKTKEYIKNLPEEVGKGNLKDIYECIYSLISNK